jgi:hypothetical protein
VDQQHARTPRSPATSPTHAPQLFFEHRPHPHSLPCPISCRLALSRALPSLLDLAGDPRPPCRSPSPLEAPLSAFRPRGVPGPTSKLSPRALAQMGRRVRSAKGGRSRRETGVKGETHDLRVCPTPRSGALAVEGYKRPRGREREAYASAVLSFPVRPTLCKRALDLPFIGVRRGSRCTMGGVAVC